MLKASENSFDEKIADLEKCMIQIGERSMSAYGRSVAWEGVG